MTISEYHTHGMMRGGIHTVHGWLILKCPDNSVLYYNNIKNPKDLSNRLITKQDTRVFRIQRKLTTPKWPYSTVIKSFESKPLTFSQQCSSTAESDIVNILIIRNPYNTLASSLAYREKGGSCNEVICDETFADLWKHYASEVLGESTLLLGRKTIVVVYDLFISNKQYRNQLAQKLHLFTDDDELPTLYMGGGSSFGTDTNTTYANRYLLYTENDTMKNLLKDAEIKRLWEKIVSAHTVS